MSTDSDRTALEGALRKSTSGIGFRPDLPDVLKRADAREHGKRLRAGLVGIVIGALVAGGVAIARTGVDHPARALRAASWNDAVSAAIPEGAWLIQGQSSGNVVTPDSSTKISGTMQDLSNDGRFVLLTDEQLIRYGGELGSNDFVGLSRQGMIESYDRSVATAQTLATAASNQSFTGPFAWSPDASSIIYRLATWDRDITTGTSHPGEPQSVVLCTLTVADLQQTCYPNAGSASGVSWSPDSAHVLISGNSNEPLDILDVASGNLHEVMPPQGTPSVVEGLRRAGLGSPTDFSDASWSASGSYLAAAASTSDGPVPVIFSPDGQFVAVGQPLFAQHLTWSPTSDILAYTTGVLTLEPQYPWGVHLLDPANGNDTLLVSTAADEDPLIYRLVWSPDGRWLALDGSTADQTDRVRIVDTSGALSVTSVSFDAPDVPAPLLDWSP
jgi:WD40 repeat protein